MMVCALLVAVVLVLIAVVPISPLILRGAWWLEMRRGIVRFIGGGGDGMGVVLMRELVWWMTRRLVWRLIPHFGC